VAIHLVGRKPLREIDRNKKGKQVRGKTTTCLVLFVIASSGQWLGLKLRFVRTRSDLKFTSREIKRAFERVASIC